MGCDSTRDSVTARDIWRDTIYRVCITVTVAPARASLAQMTSTILALLLSLPPFANEPIPEPPAARFERLTTQAEAVWLASASRPPGVSRGQWVGALLALGWLESLGQFRPEQFNFAFAHREQLPQLVGSRPLLAEQPLQITRRHIAIGQRVP